MFTSKTGLIIPTRNRPKELLSTLEFFAKKKIKFFKIIVIDSSDKKFKKEIINICNKFNIKFYFSKPSTSKQRNIGLKKLIIKKLKFIMFLDDDLIFYKNSFKIMNTYIEKYKSKFAGFSFSNNSQQEESLIEKIKFSNYIEKIGLYSPDKGKVLNNGWQTKISNLKKNLQCQWLPTACVIYKKDFLIGKYFNESFGAYSYLEDLDFSLQINQERQNIFLVVANAKFLHLKEVIRTSFVFGYYEFLNRYKIVKKFKLKKKSFFLMASCKIILTVFSILINYKNIFKLFGNITAIILCLIFY
jgi:ribosomal protein S16